MRAGTHYPNGAYKVGSTAWLGWCTMSAAQLHDELLALLDELNRIDLTQQDRQELTERIQGMMQS